MNKILFAVAVLVVAVPGRTAAGRAGEAGAEPRFRWTPSAQPRDVRGVFAHSRAGGVAAASAVDGVWCTADAGRSWTRVEASGPDAMGDIAHAAFTPHRADRLWLASSTRGVWLAESEGDGRWVARRVGSTAAGLASDAVARMVYYEPARAGEVWLALHGSAATGISLSDDGGQSWRVMASEYFARDLAFAVRERPREAMPYEAWLLASHARTPDRVSLWSAETPGDHWLEELRDVLEGEGVAPALRRGPTFWATGDKGLLRTAGATMPVRRVGPADADEWRGVAAAPGTVPGEQVLLAYAPAGPGMIVSRDNFATWRAMNDGLRTGGRVRGDARIAAAADGRTFYASVNGRLHIARAEGVRFGLRETLARPAAMARFEPYPPELLARMGADEGRLGDSRVAPKTALAAYADTLALMERAAPLFLAVTARVDPDRRPAALRVDASALGRGMREMVDDGLHGDGLAGDGVYGALIPLTPGLFRNEVVAGKGGGWASSYAWPAAAPLTLTVEASASDGRREAALVTFPVDRRPTRWSYPAKANPTTVLPIRKGRWREEIPSPLKNADITGFNILSFQLRADKSLFDSLTVSLMDNSDRSPPAESARVVVSSAGGAGRERTADGFVRVVVPLSSLLGERTAFQAAYMARIVFSGDAVDTNQLQVRDVAFMAEPMAGKSPLAGDAEARTLRALQYLRAVADDPLEETSRRKLAREFLDHF